MLAEYYEEVSHNDNYDHRFQTVKRNEERNTIDFSTVTYHACNIPFTVAEMKDAQGNVQTLHQGLMYVV